MSEILTYIGGAIAFSLALIQFIKAEKWKKSEFASKEDEKLFTNQKLRKCIMFLDWPSFPFDIPEEFKNLANLEESNSNSGESSNFLFEHNWEKVAEAMKDRENKKYFWWERMYREYFAELFNHFEKINHYIDIKLCSPDDLHHTKYYLEMLFQRSAQYKHFAVNVTNEQRNVFDDFLTEYYENGNVFKLDEKFKARQKEKANQSLWNKFKLAIKYLI